MKNFYIFFYILLVLILNISPVIAADPAGKGPSRLDAIQQLRMKQQDEENSPIRVIQQPTLQQVQQVCTPAQRMRARLAKVGAKQKEGTGNVTVNAGHGDVSLDKVSGQVDNSVNVQIINPNSNDENCL